jgi:hypothetical protein
MAKHSNRKSSSTTKNLVIGIMAGIGLTAGGLLLSLQTLFAADIVVYKSPTCGCCKAWVDHLEENGFTVEVHDRYDMPLIKQQMGVPRNLQSCHTAQVGDYVIEGHVPASEIARLIAEKPAVKGLTVPGMPMGSPGMEGPRNDPYDVLTFQDGNRPQVYSRHNQ